jgi:hypothetical protein
MIKKHAPSFWTKCKKKKELADPFRIFSPTTNRFTWQRTKRFQQARLDFFLITPILFTSEVDTMIKPSFRYDHSIILLKLKFVSLHHGKGLWKHNNSLLKDLDYLKEINNIIDKTIIQYAFPIYNYENILDINPSDLQLTINNQLFR